MIFAKYVKKYIWREKVVVLSTYEEIIIITNETFGFEFYMMKYRASCRRKMYLLYISGNLNFQNDEHLKLLFWG